MDVPEGWTTPRVDDVARIQIGRTPARNVAEYWDSELVTENHWASISDLSGKWLSETKERITARAIAECRPALVPAGTPLMSFKLTIGRAARAAQPLYTNEAIAAFLPKDDSPATWDPEFLFYTLPSAAETVQSDQAVKGATLNKAKMREMVLRLPPLPEQRKIAEILGSVDEAIQATQAVIDQTRKVKQGLLQQLLTRGIGHTRFKQTEIGEIPESWEVVGLSQLATFVTSGSRGWAKYYADDGPLFLRSQNVRVGRLDFSDEQRVQPPNGSEGTRTRVRPGDLLITITGNSVGNVAFVPSDLEEAYVSQHVGLVRLQDPELHRWIVAFFSPDGPGNEQILAAQYGQSKPGLNLTNLRELKVPVAPAEERAAVEDKVLTVASVQRANADDLVRLGALKSGLMSDLLSGRVRVKVSA